MNFRTVVNISKKKQNIDYQSKLLLVGSCFAENIGKKLDYYKFNTISNPFGIMYNPLSVANCLQRIINQRYLATNDLIQYNNRWFSLEHHGYFSHIDKNKCLEQINNNIEIANQQLKEASHLFLTLGTAYAYYWNKKNTLVANCHKMPQAWFNRKILTVNEIYDKLQKLLLNIQQYNTNLQVLFTVSPIRHWKDGATKNNISKATLHLAIHHLCSNYPNFVSYFPAYEIMMDDLRDYRFYAPDMLHPSETSINYIWQQFVTAYIREANIPTMKKIEQIQKAINHKPFNPNGKEHQLFLRKLVTKITELQSTCPNINLNKELNIVKQQIM